MNGIKGQYGYPVHGNWWRNYNSSESTLVEKGKEVTWLWQLNTKSHSNMRKTTHAIYKDRTQAGSQGKSAPTKDRICHMKVNRLSESSMKSGRGAQGPQTGWKEACCHGNTQTRKRLHKPRERQPNRFTVQHPQNDGATWKTGRNLLFSRK